ncbi:MAG: Conserved hypothetical phage protein (DUF2376) [Rhodobacteraceae bacterium HLUCCA08]|nr:MAG: Conserved hypothetical phage protein (DUF2376) [Rhodobacteraceae bacterium HLUCCA08]
MPHHYWGAMMQWSLTLAEAQAVIALRMMGMAGVWTLPPAERQRMVAEKVWAATRSLTDTHKALLRGAAAPAVLAAAIAPVRRKTRSNARRLAKAGPRGL